MFWSRNKVYQDLDGKPLTGAHLAQVTDLYRFLANERGVSWVNAAAFHHRMMEVWPKKGERRRFWEWLDASNAVITGAQAGTDPAELQRQAWSMFEDPLKHQTDIFAAQLIEDSRNVLASGNVDLTAPAAMTFCARTIQVATELTLGRKVWPAWDHLPEMADIEAGADVLTELWSGLSQQEYVAASPIWDNALQDRSQDWWDSYKQCFWHVPPHRAIAEQVIPGFRPVSEQRLANEMKPTQASSSSQLADSAIRQMVGNSQLVTNAMKFDTRTIYGHPGWTTY